MPKFQMKPIAIEVEQWFPPGHPQHVPGLFVMGPLPVVGTVQQGAVYKDQKRAAYFFAQGPLMLVSLGVGDWLLKNEHGAYIDIIRHQELIDFYDPVPIATPPTGQIGADAPYE